MTEQAKISGLDLFVGNVGIGNNITAKIYALHIKQELNKGTIIYSQPD